MYINIKMYIIHVQTFDTGCNFVVTPACTHCHMFLKCHFDWQFSTVFIFRYSIRVCVWKLPNSNALIHSFYNNIEF